MTPQPRTLAEDRFWITYEAQTRHFAGCTPCKAAGANPCPEGARLVMAHRAAKAAKRKERA